VAKDGLGSSEPEAELSALVYIVKSKNKSKYSCNELKVSRQLENLEKTFEKQSEELKELKENSEQPEKSWRWFRGLGQPF
jgi:flagellar biosynthesis chaperone FliJ